METQTHQSQEQSKTTPNVEVQHITMLSEEELYSKWKTWNTDEKYDALMFQKLTVQFIKDHIDEINWYAVSLNLNLNIEILDTFPDKIKWNIICTSPNKLSDTILYNYYKYIDWSLILPKQQLDIKLLVALSEIYRKSKSKKAKLFWNAIGKYQKFDVEYVDAYKRFLDFNYLSMNPHLDDQTIDKYFKNFNLIELFKTKQLTEEILIKHKGYIKNWYAEHDSNS